MRQNRPFPPPLPSEPTPEPVATPTRMEVLRHRFGRFFTRYRYVLPVLIAVVLAFGSMLAYDSTSTPPQHLTQRDINSAVERALETVPPRPSFASQAYQVIRPSLVSVVAGGVTSGNETGEALGAGVIVDDSGSIITCLHVVDGSDNITVVFADGSQSAATVEVSQPENDLAVLRPEIIPDDIVPATLGSSTGLRVGDEVIAVGNPFGLRDSVSDGVISGLGRSFQSQKTGQVYTGLIQFDAAVNPGNSGGPLLNRDGEVIGIITGLLNPTDQTVFIGIGFAVTVETAGGAAGAPPV